jgi:serine/threonine-protein kinase
VLYAALTGRPPFPRGTVPATMAAHLHDPPPRPSQTPGVPAAFDAVVARALAKDPIDRHPSAGDLARAARAAVAGEMATARERTVARGTAAPGAGAPAAGEAITALAATALAGHRERAENAAPRSREPPAARAPVPAGPRAAQNGVAAEQRPGLAQNLEDRGAPPGAQPPRVHGARPRPARIVAALLGAAAVVAIAVGAGIGPFGGSAPSPTAPLSADEIRNATRDFAAAYAAEDARALAATLTRDVQRITPGDEQHGRAAVVAQYRHQFAAYAIKGYELGGLQVRAGGAGRASGTYTVTRADGGPIRGEIVFGVVRDGGRPRIALISARPQP